MSAALSFVLFFFFNDTATTEIYTLSLHDALPIYTPQCVAFAFTQYLTAGPVKNRRKERTVNDDFAHEFYGQDRKSTRLNSSHDQISYAVFCLKKKTKDVHNKRYH